MKATIFLWVGTVACAVALTAECLGQKTDAAREFEAQARKESIIESLRSGYFGSVTPKQASEAQEGQLIPLLEELFAENRDAEIRERIASTLGGLGVHDDLYWNFLAEQAMPAIESDAPFETGCEGPECVGGQPASFAAWAKAHNIAPDSAAAAISGNWQHVTLLAASMDPRAIPLLRRALHSPNESVASEAARGLAQLHDNDSVAEIVAVCRQARPFQATVLAGALQLFGTPEADRAAQEFLPKPPDPVGELSKDTDFPGVWVEQAAEKRRVDAIPVLEAKFAASDDAVVKAHVASALVRLGDKDDRYWDFLAREARAALEKGIPFESEFDSDGKMKPGVSRAFENWAKARGETLEQAGNEEEHAMAAFGFLALTGDKRAVPLLRQGLLAPNPMVQSQAADGLAKLQDNESVPLLIDACERAPSGAKLGLAEALASFDSPDALATARKYLPGAVFEEIRTRSAARHGPHE